MAIADSGASHVILPTSALPEKRAGKPATLRLAAGQVRAVEHHREIFADHVTVPLCPLGRVIHNWDLRLFGHTELNFDMLELFGNSTWIDAMPSER